MPPLPVEGFIRRSNLENAHAYPLELPAHEEHAGPDAPLGPLLPRHAIKVPFTIIE